LKPSESFEVSLIRACSLLVGVHMRDLKSFETGTKLSRLQLQQDLLGILVNGHQFWAKNSDDHDIAAIHLEIATTIQSLRAQYNRLLAMYRRNS
jgi:hypothetical protein